MISKLGMLSAPVSEILEKDHETRRVGIQDDLFSLEELHPSPWNYSYPTVELDSEAICSGDEQPTENNFPPSPPPVFSKYVNNATFVNDFFSKYPIFKKLFNKESANLLLAGGSISNMLSGYKKLDNDDLQEHRAYNMGDFDFFFYGLNPTEASQKLDRVMKILLAEDNASGYEHNHMDIYNNRNCICFAIRQKTSDGWSAPKKMYEIQIIMRVFKSPSEILHGFDLGSSAVGFDGQRVYLTTLSKFCYNHGVNLIDPTRRSPSYEFRNWKYLKRGFKLVFPQLNINQIQQGQAVSLPHLEFTPTRIKGNRILIKELTRLGEYAGPISDYGGQYNFSPHYGRGLWELRNLELKYLMEDDSRNRLHCHEGMNSLLNGESCLTEEYIRDQFDRYFNKLTRGQNQLPDLDKLKFFLGPERYAIIIHKALIEQPKDINGIKAILTDAADFVIARWKESYTGIVWMTENPGGDSSPLNGSFNPASESDLEYYGPYFQQNLHETMKGWFNWG